MRLFRMEYGIWDMDNLVYSTGKWITVYSTVRAGDPFHF